MKKLFLVFIAVLSLAACSPKGDESGKIEIIATLFPQYDFARQIGGDKAEVTLLLPAGQEAHLYDPSPKDMEKIASSDVFIYTGEMMEGWAADIASSVGGEVKIVDASEGAAFIENTEDAHAHEHDSVEAYDPHIWLDFDNAKTMCDNIASALIEVSPENKAYFEENLAALKNELDNLDSDFAAVCESSDKTLVFGGRFALGYLTHRYNIKYVSAYASCGAEAEPSVKDIQYLTDFVKDNNIKAVYCEEFSDPKIARLIAGDGAEVLVLHSAHNTSADERESGATFISIMRRNLENIKKGLE